jgi:hypothetical protein
MRSDLRKPGLLLLALVSLVVACGSPRHAAESADHTHGADHTHEEANTVVGDVLPDADLAELGRASDVAVLGQVVAAVDGVHFGSDTNADHTVVTVAVEEILKGDAGTKTVDVAMLTRVHGVPLVIAGRPTPKVDERGIWMLRAIPPEFGREGYVLTNQNSQILAGHHGLTSGDESSPSAQEVKRLGDLDSVLKHLRTAVA